MTTLSAATPSPTANTPPSVADLLASQRAFFATGQTKPLSFRIDQLQRLGAAIEARKNEIVQAVRTDLGRSEYEGYFEIGAVGELKHILKNLKSWAKPRKVKLALAMQPGSAWVQPEPLGAVLIFGAWNYPFQLVMSPLMGAIAAGNCAIVKPSEHAPATSQLLAQLIADTFDPSYIAVVEGGVEAAQSLLAERFDHILYTGGARVGKLVMAAAAQHLTPVTLELGGKSPCIVAPDADVAVTARRIVWGKLVNAGQTCIAPDYLLVQESVKPALMAAMKEAIEIGYGEDPARSPDLARLVNEQQFDRVARLLAGEEIFVGGQTDRASKYIAPTILNNVDWDAPVMQEEIFGPVLPVLTYQNIDEAIAQINARHKPLALYLFSRNKALQNKVIAETSSGGVCINDVFLHSAVWNMPFGGVGNSGMGAYHGKISFETFSHLKGVLKKPFWADIKWRYAPYGNKVTLLKKLISLT